MVRPYICKIVRGIIRVSYQEESLLNRRRIVHWSEEVLLNCQDHKFLEEAISHHKLLGSTRNVPVVVKDPHA